MAQPGPVLNVLPYILRDEHVRQMLLLPFKLPFTLRRFFGDRISVSDAKDQLRHELQNREQRFLALARTRVYSDPQSPYALLLRHAGCELADLDAALRQDGLEATLEGLAREGVYLTPTEFKGKHDVVRNTLRFRVNADDLSPRYGPDTPATFVTQSSGSTDRPVRFISSLSWHASETLAFAAFAEAHGLLNHLQAAYEPALAGIPGGIHFPIMLARLGVPFERWFARPVPVNNWLEAAYSRITAHELALAGSWFGPGFARPEVVGTDELLHIIQWVEACSHDGHSTCIRTVASNASRIARVAIAAGRSLAGCTFVASGEPVTVAKRRVVEQAGAKMTVVWGYEPGPVHVGLGCTNPAHGDEMHVLRHTLAVIEHPEPIVETSSDAIRPLLFTTLYPTAAKLQINVSNGDHAVLSERACGCALHEIGLTQHVHDVGSFEKLTTEGLAYSYDDLFELLETTLPDAFGGGAGDYQLVEEESAGGQTHLTLLVDPGAGPIDETRLLERLGTELAKGSRGNRFMAGVWKQTNALRLRREAPMASARGKVLPLRIAGKAR